MPLSHLEDSKPEPREQLPLVAGSAAAGVVFVVSLVAISIVCSRQAVCTTPSCRKPHPWTPPRSFRLDRAGHLGTKSPQSSRHLHPQAASNSPNHLFFSVPQIKSSLRAGQSSEHSS